jgi:hypothetical protein
MVDAYEARQARRARGDRRSVSRNGLDRARPEDGSQSPRIVLHPILVKGLSALHRDPCGPLSIAIKGLRLRDGRQAVAHARLTTLVPWPGEDSG